MSTQSWYQSMAEPVRRVFDQIVEFLPNALGALALLLVGWASAALMRAVSRRLARNALGRLGHTPAFETGLESKAKYRSLPVVIGGLVFWIVILFFAAAAIETLGLRAVSDIFGDATTYLPRVLLATVIIFAGVLLGDMARRRLTGVAQDGGFAFAKPVGRTAQAVFIIVAAMLAIDQLGLDSTVLVVGMAIAVGSAFAAAALAFGLGAGPTVGNIISAHYVLKSYEVGDSVQIGELSGSIVEIQRTAVILATPEGRLHVPARRFSEEISLRRGQGN